MDHPIARVRHERRRRLLTVRSVGHVTPRMVRVTLGGDDLEGFVSLAPDDHVKLTFPSKTGVPERRDFTPRSYDRSAGLLTIDFALHESGPASDWARTAEPGQTLEVGGPRGSLVVPHSFDWWLLIGDETALPAIGRRLEELPASAEAISVVGVTGPEEEQRFSTRARHKAVWVHRETPDDPGPLLAALASLHLPQGDGFVFIAAEAKVARSLRDYVTHDRGHPMQWMRASGYWAVGAADAHVELNDTAPEQQTSSPPRP